MFGVLGLIRFFFLKKLLGLQYYYNDLPQILIKQPLFVSLQEKKKKILIGKILLPEDANISMNRINK